MRLRRQKWSLEKVESLLCSRRMTSHHSIYTSFIGENPAVSTQDLWLPTQFCHTQDKYRCVPTYVVQIYVLETSTVESSNTGHFGAVFLFFVKKLPSLGGAKRIRTIG